ncbi:hypothetical protein GLOIN_2v1482006 [Rhizophagus irregularis DAOM 181602=DAOM 197198]|nr:hypothetical protein GLOIN_2v1482006 [Rhizophagus irregularis DAOM 181602=DAOM 197198]
MTPLGWQEGCACKTVWIQNKIGQRYSTWAQVSAYTEFKCNSYERCFITSGDSSAHYDFHFTIPDDQKSFYLNFELQFSFEENKWRGPFDIR